MNNLQKRRWVIKFHLMAKYGKGLLVTLLFRLTPTRIRLNQLGLAYEESRLFYLIVKLNVADLISQRNMHVDDLAKTLNINANNLYLLLRIFVSLGVFTEVALRVFRNNNMSIQLIKSSSSGLYQSILNCHNKHNSALWFDKLDFNAQCLASLEKYLLNEELRYVSGRRRSNINKSNFDGFNWSIFDLIVNSGNATGQHISDVLNLSERTNICIYDKPKAIRLAKTFWKNQKISSISSSSVAFNSTVFRLSFEEGEILRSLPKASSNENLYCFVNVFSGLSDDDCLTILKNTKQAVGQFSATVVVIDSVLFKMKPSLHEAIKDMQLLLEKNTKQRTLTQWNDLINKSDFTLTEIVELKSSNKVLVLKLTKS